MTPSNDSSERFNGLRILELVAAVLFITEEMSRRVQSRPQTVSTIGVRSLEEQQLLGLAQILSVVFPFSVELSLKSLWHVLHANASHAHIHDLGKLFQELPSGATDVCDARRAQDEARLHWARANPNISSER